MTADHDRSLFEEIVDARCHPGLYGTPTPSQMTNAFRFIVLCETYQTIADEMGIAWRTVDSHLTMFRAKVDPDDPKLCLHLAAEYWRRIGQRDVVPA